MISGAGILSFVARTDGFVLVPEERVGIDGGEAMEILMMFKQSLYRSSNNI